MTYDKRVAEHSFLIRNIPPELKKAAMLRARAEGRHLNAVIREFLEEYAKGLEEAMRNWKLYEEALKKSIIV